MIVETDFAYGAHRRRPGTLLADDRRRLRRVVGEFVSGMRVDANRDPHAVPERSNARGLCFLGRVAGGEDHHRRLHACGARPRHDLFEVLAENVVGQVTVTVDHQELR